jgi:putative phosphoribosyl transferase
MLFRDRVDAGRQLSSLLHPFAGRVDVLVLALPRGGVLVGFEVARALRCPLDVFVVRKLGVPDQAEFAMGAIASGGIRLVNSDVVRDLHISSRQVEETILYEQRELERRENLYRGGRRAPEVRGHVVILVDDGVATGSTMRAAIAGLRQQDPRQIIVAVPIAAKSVGQKLKDEADRFVCLATPADLYSVGEWYQNFSQITDEEVRDLLSQAMKPAEHPLA